MGVKFVRSKVTRECVLVHKMGINGVYYLKWGSRGYVLSQYLQKCRTVPCHQYRILIRVDLTESAVDLTGNAVDLRGAVNLTGIVLDLTEGVQCCERTLVLDLDHPDTPPHGRRNKRYD